MTLLGFGEDNLVFFDFEFSYISIIGASISAFLGIVMAQSGFDKIFNWEGELDFITRDFFSLKYGGSLVKLKELVKVYQWE